jgi:hypothetical protein
LLSLLALNGVTAVLGGIGLMTGAVAPPAEWLQDTIFSNYALPGVILAVIVGGSALAALYGYAQKRPTAAAASLTSGFIMVGWILGEAVVLGHYSVLQLVYLVTGLTVIYLCYSEHTATHRWY